MVSILLKVLKFTRQDGSEMIVVEVPPDGAVETIDTDYFVKVDQPEMRNLLLGIHERFKQITKETPFTTEGVEFVEESLLLKKGELQ